MTDPGLPGRVEYGACALDVEHLTDNPLDLFRMWFSDAVASGLPEVNGVCLCTSDPQEGPDGRIVLLKGYSGAGFSFFTNFDSSKGRQLQADPRSSMVFWWQPLKRQVRVRGSVERLPEADSDQYFSSRPRNSQLGAWASLQSRPVGSRQELEACFADVAGRFPEGQPVPRPERWGGYLLVPRRMEFWQGRDSRLHDRFVYERVADGGWTVQRLMP